MVRCCGAAVLHLGDQVGPPGRRVEDETLLLPALAVTAVSGLDFGCGIVFLCAVGVVFGVDLGFFVDLDLGYAPCFGWGGRVEGV